MILFTWGEQTEPEVKFADMGKRSWRWALNVEFFSIGVWLQTSSERNNEWRFGPDYYDVSVTKHFSLGQEHFWYDGPHCSFNLGFLHVNWSGSDSDCERCLEER